MDLEPGRAEGRAEEARRILRGCALETLGRGHGGKRLVTPALAEMAEPVVQQVLLTHGNATVRYAIVGVESIGSRAVPLAPMLPTVPDTMPEVVYRGVGLSLMPR